MILSHVSQFEEAKNYEEAIKLLNLFIKNGKRSQNYAHAFLGLSQIYKKMGRLLDTFNYLVSALKIT